jgi:hypothetical protein
MQMTFLATTKSLQQYENNKLDMFASAKDLEFLGTSRDTPGVLYECENKGLARQGICKCLKMMKIKIDCAWAAGKRNL